MLKKRILVIGQVPPPYGGQNIMTKLLLDLKFSNFKLLFLPTNYSKNFKQVGKFKIIKIIQLFKVIICTIYIRFKYKPFAIYYMPGGPKIIPIIRDVFYLLIVRLFYKKIIFHFRSAGLSETIKKTNLIFKHIAVFAYQNPTLSIHLSDYNPPDGHYFKSKYIKTIPNGFNDMYKNYTFPKKEHSVKILYVGVLKESKGVLDLINASKRLLDNCLDFKVTLIGEYDSNFVQEKILTTINKFGLNNYINIKGVLIGDNKWKEYYTADIFCFPTYFESESFGNVLIEAMQYSLPIVATKWRGVQSLVINNYNGITYEHKDVSSLALNLEKMIKNKNLRKLFGKNGRKKYEEEYTLTHFKKNMERAFELI